MNPPNLRRQSNRQQVALDSSRLLGSGGEAHIYLLQADPALAAKIYHTPTPERGHKLVAMLHNPPDDPARARGHTSIAWPIDLLLDGNSAVVGYLMARVQEMRPVFDYYSPSKRSQTCPGFDYSYLHRAASNLVSAVGALHERGYVIGDVNESNVLLHVTAMATIVDTDSFQVRDLQNGTLYRCPVGKPEFTPPELQNRDFKTVDRTVQHDLFGLAVLIFKLLMEGTHPFDGRYRGAGDPPLVEARIAAGHFPHGSRIVPYAPKPSAPPFDILHPELRRLSALCFEVGQTQPPLRPTAKDWRDALITAANALQTCAVNDQHHYGDHLKSCPWCELAQRLKRDSFPSKQAIGQGTHLLSATPAPTPRSVASAPSTSATPQSPRSGVQQTPAPAPAGATATPARPVPVGVTMLQQAVVTARNSLRQRKPLGLTVLLVLVVVIGLGSYATYSNSTRKPEPAISNPLAASMPTKHLTAIAPSKKPVAVSVVKKTNPKDGATMLLIPAGDFTMGSDANDDEEKPSHKVSLDSYYIYKTPVTVKQYLAFCVATGHTKPKAPSWGWKDDHPIVNVNWEDAKAYCNWAGAQLPTEAQWEKAARGPDGRTYPWGNDWDRSKCANSLLSTAPVGSYPSGASPYGVLDMAGNVWQWCADWYDENYYQNSPSRNPAGPPSSPDGYRVLRGGSWVIVDPVRFRCAIRGWGSPDFGYLDFGFRCVVRADGPRP